MWANIYIYKHCTEHKCVQHAPMFFKKGKGIHVYTCTLKTEYPKYC